MQVKAIVSDARVRRPLSKPRVTGKNTWSDWESNPDLATLKVAAQMLAEEHNPAVAINRKFGGKGLYWDRLGPTFKKHCPESYQFLLTKCDGDESLVAKLVYDRMHKGFTPKTGQTGMSSEHYKLSPKLAQFIVPAQQLYGV